MIHLLKSANDLVNNWCLELLEWRGPLIVKQKGTALTFIFSGTTHIHIPIVSGSRKWPNGNTSPWSKALLRMYDFPLRQGPAIDTTQTGPSRRSRHQKHKFHYKDPVTDIIRKQLKLRTKELKEKNSNAFDFDTICTTSGIHLAWVKPGHLQTQQSNIRS